VAVVSEAQPRRLFARAQELQRDAALPCSLSMDVCECEWRVRKIMGKVTSVHAVWLRPS
jgi:hypothetical protein